MQYSNTACVTCTYINCRAECTFVMEQQWIVKTLAFSSTMGATE